MKIILRRRLSVPKPSWFLYIFKAQNTPYLSSYISKNYCINKSKFKNLNKKFEISNLEKIYFKEYPIWAIVRGVKYEENPYFKLHFKLKDGEQFDFGLMLDDNEAKEILKEIKEFLNVNKLT